MFTKKKTEENVETERNYVLIKLLYLFCPYFLLISLLRKRNT